MSDVSECKGRAASDEVYSVEDEDDEEAPLRRSVRAQLCGGGWLAQLLGTVTCPLCWAPRAVSRPVSAFDHCGQCHCTTGSAQRGTRRSELYLARPSGKTSMVVGVVSWEVGMAIGVNSLAVIGSLC